MSIPTRLSHQDIIAPSPHNLYNNLMFYVYILKRKAKRSLYIGYSGNLRARLDQHREEYEAELIYYEAYQDAKSARIRELKLKHYGSAWQGLKRRLNLH